MQKLIDVDEKEAHDLACRHGLRRTVPSCSTSEAELFTAKASKED